MWASIIRGVLALGFLAFLMFILVVGIIDPITQFAMAGPQSDAESAQRLASYFNAMTVNNLTLIGGLAVAIYLIGRAVVEQQLG